MLKRLTQRLRDMKTIRILCESAEKHANADEQKEPGSEHFVMAALDLPEGSARDTFRRLNADGDSFRAAVIRQYEEALRDIGIELPPGDSPLEYSHPVSPAGGLYRASASGQALMQRLWELKKTDSSSPLLGAHVILAATNAQQGVTPRALRNMGIEPTSLAAAAETEIAHARS